MPRPRRGEILARIWWLVFLTWILWGISPGEEVQASSQTYTLVIFHTQDGVRLRGRMYGNGERVVVLSHMYGTDMQIWHDFAVELSRRGYRALAYNFRRTGSFRDFTILGRFPLDTLAAIDFAKRDDPEKLFLVGASMGGTASLVAAAHRQVDGVVVLSSAMKFYGLDARRALPRITVPKLFIVGEYDRPFSESARRMYQISPPPKELRVYPTAAHGTHLFSTPYAPQIKATIFQFLSQ